MFATLNSLRDANLSGNNKLGQRQEELECVQTIFRCLLQFTQLVDAHGAIPEHETDPSSSKKTKNQAVDGTTTILHAHASPLSPTSNPITSLDVIELLDLFVALLAKDPSPGRMYALVFDPRYDMIGIALALVQVGTRTEGSVAKLMAQHGAQTLTRIMSYCTAEDLPQTECTPSTSVQVSSLTDCAWTSMKTYSGASLLTEQLMQLDRMCWPDLRTSIAECLFVYVMRVAQGSDDLTSSVRPLLSIIAQEEQCELVQNYVTGVLRVTAEKHPQAFVDGWVFLQIAHVLSSTVAPYIRTLLLDVCLVVHQYHPAFFHHTVLLDSVFITTLITVAQTILTDSIYQVPNHTEPQEALCRLIVRACHTEISMPFAETDACASLAAVSLTAEFCALLLHTSGDLAPLKLRTLRWAVCACTTDWMLEVLLGATSMILPICVHVLALQPVQAYSVDVQMEIALLLSLILVKHPSVRSRVRQEALRGMREGVRAGGGMGVSKENAPTNYCDGPVLPRLNWGEEVCKRAREQLTQLPVDVLQDLPLVDAMGYALNDPRVFQFRPPVVLAHQAYAPEPPDYSNVFMVEHVATLILQQQGRDSSWLLEARPNPDSNTPNPLTVESPSFIPVTTESSTRTTELNFDERRRILSRGILCVALDMTLGGLELPTAQYSTKHRMSDLDIHPVVASGQPSRWCENTLGAGNVDLSEQGFSSVHQPANFQGKDGRFAAPPSAGPLHRYDGQEEDIREGYRFHTPQHSHPDWIKYGKGFFPRNSKAFPSIDDINAPVVVTTPRSHRGTVVAVPFRVAGPLRNGYFSQPALRASERTNFTPCLTKPGALLESTHLNDSTPQHSLLSKTRSDDRQLVPHDTMSASENDYVDMAILMYLPIIFGKHYNRSANQGPRTRILDGPDGPIVQTLPKCSTQYTWNVDAVQSKDLYRFFLPFRLISMERIEEEVDRIRKLLMRTRKNHVVTPHTARSRRWFLHDMLNYVLPKTELLLKALQNLLATHGTESVVFALRMIRMADEARRNGTSQREIALSRENGERILLGSDEISSVSDPQHSLVNSFAPSSEYTHDAIQFRTLLPMTRPVRMDEDLEAYRMDLVLEDVLRFHGERYKDVLHSGNLSYAVESIQRYFIEEGRRKQRNDAARPQHLVEIEKEIRRLEEQQERDTWENEAAAELEDDVEPEHGMAAQDCTTSGRYLSAGESCLVRRDLADSFCETKVPSSHARGIQDVLHHMGAEHLEYDDFDEKPPRALLEEAQRKRKEETFSVVSEQESRASSGLSSYSYLDYD